MIAFAIGIVPRLRIETNLLALLPSAERSDAEQAAIDRFAADASRALVVLVGSGSAQTSRMAAAAFARTLESSGAFEAVQFAVDARLLDAVTREQPYRHGLLSPRHRELLLDGRARELEQEALRALYSPLNVARPLAFADDPLGLAADFLLGAGGQSGDARLTGDFLAVEKQGRTYAVLRARTSADPFTMGTQARAMAALAAARQAAAAIDRDIDISIAGVLPHAAAATQRAKREISTFGAIGLAGVVLIVVLTFRSARPLILTTGVLAIAAMAGVTACQLVFGNVHVLTLTFGTSLTGVAVDYSIHYFAARLRAPGAAATPAATATRLAPTLVTVCATTVLGYLAMLAAPIGGLRQIALFSAAGLVAACSAVLCLYPGLDRDHARASLPAWAIRWNGIGASRGLRGGAGAVLVLTLVVVIVAGVARVRTLDDVRALQRSPQALLDEERRTRELLGADVDTRFLLVGGDSAEQVLQREEALMEALRPLVARDELAGVLATSSSLPSLRRQAENRALLARTIYADDGVLATLLARIGFDAAFVARKLEDFRASADRALTPAMWRASPVSAPYRHLWLGDTGAGFASVMLLDGLIAADTVREIASAQPGVHYVDQVAEISLVLGHYRRVATWLLGAVILVIVSLLAARFGRRAAFRLAIPATGAMLLAVGTLGLAGEPVTLLHVLSLLLVLGMGVDYAVFLREDQGAAPLLAVVLCTLTTLLSFGLLGFSSVPFVRAIGLTVSLGITFAFVLSFVARPRLA